MVSVKNKKVLMETNREIRLEPKKDLNYLFWFFGVLVFLIILTEFFTDSKTEYVSMQSRTVMVILILFAYRLFTINIWGQHYKEIINSIHKMTLNLKDKYILLSILNIILDVFILLVLFYWIELEKVSFIRVPVAGLVYILMIGFSALRRKRKRI